jgi:hypothetical protein
LALGAATAIDRLHRKTTGLFKTPRRLMLASLEEAHAVCVCGDLVVYLEKKIYAYWH